ncbi:hypothetical protein YPPY08_2777, partial [Yersinia pestis PY-08]
MAKTCIS